MKIEFYRTNDVKRLTKSFYDMIMYLLLRSVMYLDRGGIDSSTLLLFNRDEIGYAVI